MYHIWVIPGWHACRSGMLMLEHKGVPYRGVDFVTLTHAVMSRLHGFDAGGQTRNVGGRRTLGIRLGDLLGTVPGLADGDKRISTNYAIARYLDQQHPEPSLFPGDPDRRTQVEEAERWANDTLQMEARRLAFAGLSRDPSSAGRLTADGRMGYLLYQHELARRLLAPWIGRLIFATTPAED